MEAKRPEVNSSAACLAAAFSVDWPEAVGWFADHYGIPAMFTGMTVLPCLGVLGGLALPQNPKNELIHGRVCAGDLENIRQPIFMIRFLQIRSLYLEKVNEERHIVGPEAGFRGRTMEVDRLPSVESNLA